MALKEIQKQKTRQARAMEVYKRDDMLQKARFNLSVNEQRVILYAVSQIKPNDTAFQEYHFELSDFYALCGIKKDTYTELKKSLKKLSDKSWWALIDDKGTESLLRWFTTLKISENSGEVVVKFHEDMFPFLLELQKQQKEKRLYYTGYELRYILPMQSKYGIRLYEVLKSYQKNNQEWYFETDKIMHLLDCDKYIGRYPDFNRRALKPAFEDINRYTDLKIEMETETKGKKVTYVRFYMYEKSDLDKALTKSVVDQLLEAGQMNLFDDELKKQKEQHEQVREKVKKETI